MYKYKLLIALFMMFPFVVSAQSNINSPYSRYGLGDIYQEGFGQNIAMGYTGVAMSEPSALNPINPAANSNILTQRFIFDVGLEQKFSTWENANSSQKASNCNFKYLSGGFAAKPWWFFTFGLKPYSQIGYNVVDSIYLKNDATNTITPYSQEYKGEGGLNRVDISTSFKMFKRLTLGVDGSVLFGSVDRVNNVVYSQNNVTQQGSWYTSRNMISGVTLDAGFLYQENFKSKKDSLKTALKLALGGVYGFGNEIKSRNELFITRYDRFSSISDTICNDTINKTRLKIPSKLALGISMELMEKFTINVDYQKQDWSKFSIGDQGNTNLKNSVYYGVGMQFVADRYSSKYYKTIVYRIGAHQKDTYLNIANNTIKDQGLTVGLGFPIRSLFVNISCDFGKRGTINDYLYQEKYCLLHFNVVMHDVWFVKRKFQ